MSLRRRVMGQSGGDAGFFEVIDLVLDNRTASTPEISPSDMSFDNYLVQYSVVETGTYQDGVLTMDETPTIPTGKNIPLTGSLLYLDNPLGFTGKYGSSSVSDAYSMNSAFSVVRGYVSTYGSSAKNTRGTTYLTLRSQYAFGSSGMYMKYRCYVHGWNNP